MKRNKRNGKRREGRRNISQKKEQSHGEKIMQGLLS